MKKLAIIIPAYKTRFFRDVLESIARQDNQDFAVYVGDDASPEDLESIVAAYKYRIDITYVRFEQNLGGKDLVAHWERCIQLSQEPLVWLFSDDDWMPKNAVSRILEAAATRGETKFFARFPLSIIDAERRVTFSNPPFEAEQISGYQFLLDKLYGKISSAACEFVFSRDVWKETGGFVKFPLAWCSDDATWSKFGDYAGGLLSLYGDAVCWRNVEGQNISNSSRFDSQKLEATALFIEWIRSQYPAHIDDADLHTALAIYVHVILYGSVRRVYSLKSLFRLCKVLGGFSKVTALRVWISHVGKAHL